MIPDKRYKELMESVGLPNSRSLLLALKQCAMEAVLIERENKRLPKEDIKRPKNELVSYH